MLVAAAATAFFACQKPEVIVPEFEEVNGLAFSSEKPSFDDETKTEWTGESIQWSAGDKIRVAYTCDGVWQNADGTSVSSEESGSKTAKIYESKAITEPGSTAFFSVPGYFKGTAEGVYEFYGIYPSSLVSGADIKYAPSVTITIPTVQTPTASSFDSAADVMASKSQSYVGIPKEGENNGPISLKWERLVAHGHFTLKNLAVEGEEDIQTITLTANADADMVGTHYLYLDTYNVVKPNSNAAPNSITINSRNLSIDSEGNVTFWASFLPCTWTSIDVKVKTDKASYTRKIDLSSNQKTFAKNARNILAVNMASAVREAKTSNPLPFVKDFSDKKGTTGITELDGFTVSGNVYNAEGAIRLAKGDAGGSITTQSLDLSCDFHVKVTASGWDSDELSLIVSSGDQSETVTLSAVGNGNSGPGECAEQIINFQPVSNSSSVTFAAAAGKRCYIKKIEILEGHAVAAPVLEATTPNKIAAEGGEGSFTFTLANPKDGQSVSAKSNVDWITGESVSGNTVTYTVEKNTSEESREGTITLSYEGAQSVNVVIAQAGKPAEGGDDEESGWVSTAFADLKDGDQVVIVSTKSTNIYAMSNNNGTDSAPAAVEVKYSNDKLSSEPEAILVWTVEISGSNYIFHPGSDNTKWLYCTSTNNGVRVGTNDNKTFVMDTSGYLKHVATSRYLGVYNNQDWRCYTNTTGNTAGQTFKFFVKKGRSADSGETPDPEEPTLTPRNLAFSSTTATATVGLAFTTPTLSGVTTGVTYSSSNTAVATVDASTGAVTLVGAGSTTITATAPETAEYEAGEATYTLTVNPAAASTKKTYTLTISTSDFNGTSYAANNNEKTSTATASDGSTMQVKWTSNQVMLQSSVMQWQKSNGYIYNSTDLGTITNIAITSTAGTFTKYIGTSQKPTSSGNGGYFQIKVGSVLGKTSTVVITFEK